MTTPRKSKTTTGAASQHNDPIIFNSSVEDLSLDDGADEGSFEKMAIDHSRPYLIGPKNEVLQLPLVDEKTLRADYDDPKEANTAILEMLHKQQLALEEKAAAEKHDKELPATVRKKSPGYGADEGQIEIHMRQVFNHVCGRNEKDKHKIHGLYSFGSVSTNLVKSYQSDNSCPFAAWYLCKIEDKIDEIKRIIKERRERVAKITNKNELGMECAPFTSQSPCIEKLHFGSVYGFQVGALLNQYDTLLRQLFPYVRLQFVSHKIWETEFISVGKHIRSLLNIPMTYMYVGKRAVEENGVNYLAALERMGALPEEFKKGKRKPNWVLNNNE